MWIWCTDMTQLRNLHLYGDLAKVYGKTHKVFAPTFKDALRIVDCNHPGFLRRVGRGQWHCLRGHRTLKHSFEMAEHHVSLPLNGDFHLIPVAAGGKGRTAKIIFTIIIGGALLATGIGGALGAFGAAATGLGVAGTSLSLSFTTLALMGGGLLLGGLSMLLTPTPKDSNADAKKTSFTFDGPVNTADEGSAIPVLYGELIVGGVTIASDVRNGYGTMGGGGTTKSGFGGSGVTIGGGSGIFSYAST
jgi:predicted phage tail protein